MTAEMEMNVIKNGLLEDICKYGLAEKYEAYWMKRAEIAARALSTSLDSEATAILKAQISICYETVDETRRTREAREAEAKAGRAGTISATQGGSVV